jgi:Domain of unknown function (DUF3332)
MNQFWAKIIFYVSSFLACTIMALSTGCASGGFKITRDFAGWVNTKHIVLRCILYILTLPVFAVLMLIDLVIFNTIDFWEGRVSQGTYEFKDGDKTYFVKHEILPGSRLKRSTIQLVGANGQQIQESLLRETLTGEIEYLVDGKLRSRVSNISSLPIATIFDSNEKLLEEKALLFIGPDAPTRAVAKK